MNIPGPRKRMSAAAIAAAVVALQKQLGLELNDTRLWILGAVVAVYMICQTATDIMDNRAPKAGPE